MTSFAAHSRIIAMEVVPSTWKLENYMGDNVVAWFTGSSCNNGRISFPSNATLDDKNRFVSVMLTAKISSKKMFVRYDDSTPNCEIKSFGMHNP